MLAVLLALALAAPAFCGSDIKGQVQLADFVKLSKEGQSVIRCQKTQKVIDMQLLRNGDCDCSPDSPSGHKPKCYDPECSECEDATDELCPKGTFFCDTGSCLNVDLLVDSKLDCPNHCVEPDVQEQCRKERDAKLTHVSSMKNKQQALSVCSDMRRRGKPFDCVMDPTNEYCKKILDDFEECEKIFQKPNDSLIARLPMSPVKEKPNEVPPIAEGSSGTLML